MFRPMGLLAGVIAVRCVPATKKPAKVKLNPRHVFFFSSTSTNKKSLLDCNERTTASS